MMRLLLLLCACVVVGLSYEYDEHTYGTTYRISLHRKTQTLEFNSDYGSDRIVLWKRDEPQARKDDRRKVVGSYFVISNVTQKDSGRYSQRGENRVVLSRNSLSVTALTENYHREVGESLKIAFNLEEKYCNIYFFPSDGSPTTIVRHGWHLTDVPECTGFKFVRPCGIFNENLQESCRGNFEIKDVEDNSALLVGLDMEAPPFRPSYLGIGGGILISTLCTCCMRFCCCKKKSSDKESSDAAAAEDNENEPAVQYHEYDHEPIRQRQNQLQEPSGTQYPTQPSYTPAAAPLIHNPPTDIMPPSYSEVAVFSEPADAPTVPLYSDVEPRFEVKGMNFNSDAPLSSDPTHCSVYTSDKLNFL